MPKAAWCCRHGQPWPVQREVPRFYFRLSSEGAVAARVRILPTLGGFRYVACFLGLSMTTVSFSHFNFPRN